MNLVWFSFFLLCSFCFTHSKKSEYQLESEVRSPCEQLRAVGAAQRHDHVPQCSEDGRYRHVQCNRGGECWCVDADGAETPGSRRNGSAVHCLTSCQRQRQRAQLSGESTVVSQCLDSGEYQPVQCDGAQGQCWCVDLDGMEIYGTRQNGRPSRCPALCEVRERRLLHGVGEASPPQCADDGSFLPVQCKFINTTDMMVFDLLHGFNRLPEVFQTFSAFRKTFPDLSSYCYCADSRGRELPNTGVELLLSEVYDTAFSSLDAGRSFSQSNIYRILQRRYLAVQLALSGQFRCPSTCERERSSSSQADNVFVPSCDARGDFLPVQCQAGGQCWCVDSDGREIFGTRQTGVPDCSAGPKDCRSERRRALSRLFYGPVGYFSQNDVFSAFTVDTQDGVPAQLPPCSPEFQELLAKSGLLSSLPETERSDVGDVMAELVQGTFPTGGLAIKALSLSTNPKRLQENLFGGKFLKNVGKFNFTGAVGTSGTLRFSHVFTQIGLIQNGEDLSQLAKSFSDDSIGPNLDQTVSDSFGRSVNLKRNQDLVKLISATLENEQFFTTLREAIGLLRAEDSSHLGALFRALFQNSDVCKPPAPPSSIYVPRCAEDGQYQEIQCQDSECWCVDSQGLEVMGSHSASSTPRCPSRCEKERATAVAAKAGSSAGSEVFIPNCQDDGEYMAVQCLGRDCFCVDGAGVRLDTPRPGAALQCPTDCQLTASQHFLNTVNSVLTGPASVSQLSDVYVPRCTSDGSWHRIQCDGPPEQAFDFYRRWIQINDAGKQRPVPDLLKVLQEYRTDSEAMASFQGFLSALFQAGHHKVFPALSRFDAFSELPLDLLDGTGRAVSGPSVLLNPFSLWRLLSGYSGSPGPLLDFSAPLGHFSSRQCWCVDQKGNVIPETKAQIGKVPKCPCSCSLVQDRANKFSADVETLISSSNSSHIPAGYGFLLAKSVRLRPEEMQQDLSPGFQISEAFLSGDDSALRLAAHSTVQFYWQSHLTVSERYRPSLLLGYQPYSPQCDSSGQWLPSQCHSSTGHCWCVDEDGGYITGSLTARTIRPPQCKTTCQRLRDQFVMSVWSKSPSDTSSSYSPSCEEDGTFPVLQTLGAAGNVASCVSPVTGTFIQSATLSPAGEPQCPGWCSLQKSLAARREAGVGYEPECVDDGDLFWPLQCDQVHCWCVSESGQEIPSTRRLLSQNRPSCDAPQCPLLFGSSVSHGAVLCSNHSVVGGRPMQLCEVFCLRGFVSSLPAKDFLCDPATESWLSDAPLSHTCQRVQPLQTAQASATLQMSLTENQPDCRGQSSSLKTSILTSMRAAGLCSLQLSPGRYTSVCDESFVSLECVSQRSLAVNVTFITHLSDLPVNVLPDLHDIDAALGDQKKLDVLTELIRSESYEGVSVSASPASFGCSAGFWQLPDSSGCVLCPAGSFSAGPRCRACPRGSYQAEAGQDFCSFCSSGTSTAAQGAFNPSHCVSDCQQSKLNCTDAGNFLSAQKHFLSGKWLCVSSRGEELNWTSADEPVTSEQCRILEKFQAVAVSSLRLGSEDAAVLHSDSSSQPLEMQIRKCVLDCAEENSCQYVSVFLDGGRTLCDLYTSSTTNVDCRSSQQSKGFLGNEGAETFQTLNCRLKVKVGDEPGLTVIRKKGHEFDTSGPKSFARLGFHKVNSGVYRTLVFQAAGSSLADVHRVCADACSEEGCCDGFVLNQNVLDGGSVICGLMSFPGVLQCNENDWDLRATAPSSRTCGAGVSYNKEQRRFTFEFGGQNFTITDSALPASSKNKTDYQATLISFQQVYLWTESDMNTRSKAEEVCGGPVQKVSSSSLSGDSDSIKENFEVLDATKIKVDLETNTSNQLYWVFKQQFTAAEAQLWCLKRCMEEELCHVADLRDESRLYYSCILYPDTRVCGAYDKPLRQACDLVLPQEPQNAYHKKINLSGSVKIFYDRVPFRKMVSYSVRSRVSVLGKSITEGFFECERRCDEDPCCRGIGYVRDTGASDVLCLTLNSLGIQTCAEDERTTWRVQDCSPSKVQTTIYPFGWYEKPVNHWTTSPGICPPFKLRSPSKAVDLNDWRLLDASSVLVDASVSAFDKVHISRDIAEDPDRVRDWCLAACEENDSCTAVSVSSRESALSCVMYPDTHVCLPTSRGQHCVFLTKEPAQKVYLRTVLKPDLSSLSLPGHGTLLGKTEMKLIGVSSRSVTYFLGVPYARPPVGQLRFSAPQAPDWTGTWNATFARPSCLQPGDLAESGSSEDCLYLNIFVPAGLKLPASVLLFFHNSGSGSGSLDGSYLAAAGNVIVVTANFRVAAFGFLSTGSGALQENYGLQDQASALTWLHWNIALFGGDPTRVTVGADRNGADVASLHLLSSSSSSLFHQALLMGGSAFSPAAVTSRQKARTQTESLAAELSCSSSDPAQVLSCLREKPAQSVNAAQTKLLAVSGPLQAWSPVMDGVLVKEQPSAALKVGRFHGVPLMLGSSAEDGLISRAKNIKNFEQLQGRADSKTAFYEALSNSLGGDDANVLVKEAATWFYSLQHSPTPSGYSVFSRALENATRDFFITCPSVEMARFWSSNTRSGVYMYRLPEEMVQTSVDISSPLDVQYVFGVPHVPAMRDLFTSTQRTLSLQIMTYVANFIKSGNPNLPSSVSAASFGELLPPWSQFLPHPNGQNYKELMPNLINRKSLQADQCSFWSQYVPALSASTGKFQSKISGDESGPPSASTPQPMVSSDFSSSVTQSKPKPDKDGYS